MDEQYKAIFSRNIGFFTESEQARLRRSTVAIAGVGGVGGLLAERLLRLGIGHLKITDPGVYEESNLNRQFGSSLSNIGQSKVEAVYTLLRDINPQAQIDWDSKGIVTTDDAYSFTEDCDLVIDEMDFGLYRESISLQRAARDRGIYYAFASALGFGAMVMMFDPKGPTLEEYNKLPVDLDLNNIEKIDVPLERIAPVIPSYANKIPADMIEQIIAGERPGPTTSIGTGLASILTANETIKVILKRPDIVKIPQYIYIDLMDRQFIVGSVE
jgi:molybdopterin/thiamine biosynthesis adenylyltransferase